MTKSQGNKRVIAAIALVAVIVGGAATALAQSQRFSDVPPEHEAFEAIEWAADVELTLGYGDGTFKPEQPLSKRHAGVFMERYYDLILQATESPDFTRGDMMRVLKAINDGSQLPEAEAEAETATETAPEARWLPRPEDRTAEGRCAHRIRDGIYDWEDCAWGNADDPVMGRDAMQELADRVWAETQARGKPANPPALTEGQCSGWRTSACYIPDTHTISIESGVTLRTILHELAHAVISGDDIMADCMADWDHAVATCAHGDLFRCAADALFNRYADIDAAGVCGAVPDYGAWTRYRAETIDGHYTEWRTTTDAYGGDTPGIGGDVTLGIRCAQGQRTVYLNGTLAYSHRIYAPQLMEYRFGDESTATRVAANVIDNPDGGYGDWWVLPPPTDGHLLAGLTADESNRLFVRLSDEDGVEAETTLRTTGWADFMSVCE